MHLLPIYTTTFSIISMRGKNGKKNSLGILSGRHILGSRMQPHPEIPEVGLMIFAQCLYRHHMLFKQ